MATSKRHSSVRLPQAFARDRSSKEPCPPLADLMQGGGEVRLKVMLTVLMMATKAPHARKVSAKDLAAMLGLRDADGAGARRVSKAMKDLEAKSLARRDRVPGYVPTMTVLDPAGSGKEWDASKLPRPYITVPISLWRRGWFIALSGRAVALLIILKELTGGRTRNGAWVDGIRKRQYGLSDDTWTRGTQELKDAGLLDVTEQVFSSQGEPRRRNLYVLHLDRLEAYDPGGFEEWRDSQDE
ncbi:hypothetical protein N866_18835 [Actinotalea ferrariae CF5-4]|uniref:Replication protein n=1 Tax=Actinotalea ferrariae CF5-4 TaxID=948458 RepID=A0A021W126_9CELL|nr:hypothetical protein N866_18835 [Actinotalea ferrariae CF5-4]